VVEMVVVVVVGIVTSIDLHGRALHTDGVLGGLTWKSKLLNEYIYE
jgi:hypothetical protein